MTSRKLTNAAAMIVAVTGLAACTEDVAETAQKNGCPQLEHRIEKLFVTAGLYDGARRDEEARPSNNLQQAINRLEEATGPYSQASYDVVRAFYANAPHADSPFLPKSDGYGSLLVRSIEATEVAKSDDVNFGFFKACETYVNQRMADDKFVSRLELLFASPHTWKE